MKEGDGAEPDAIVEAGRAGDHFSWRDIVRDGGLRGEDDAVADGAVAGDAHLTGENDVVADDRGAGEAGLRAEQRVVADAGAVADLNEVVDLCAVADFCCADGGAIDGGVGLDVNAAADADGAGLGNFFPMALFVFGKAEAVRADDGAVFKRDVIAEDAVFANDGMGVREEVTADLYAGIEHDVGQKSGVRAEAHVGTDDRVGADVRAGADFRSGINDGSGVDAGRISGRLIEESERAVEGVVGVLDAQGCGGDFLEFGLDDDGGGAGGSGESGVAGIRDEGDFGGAGYFNPIDAGNFEVCDCRGVLRPDGLPIRLASLRRL